MVDYDELMRNLSVPRPTGSKAESKTARWLKRWLTRHGIVYQVHPFAVRPYFYECLGLWLIVSRSLLALSVWLHWGWVTLPIAVLGIIGGVFDVAFHLPVVTWPGTKRGDNLLVTFDPPQPRQEIVLCAHYDSKTELFDHRIRGFFFRNVRFGLILSLLLGLVGPLERSLRVSGSDWATQVYWAGVALTLPLLLMAWGLGLNFTLGRLLRPSQGAVDNGAGCAILLGLAKRLAAGSVPLGQTRVTIALFTAEEVNMQGSRAYVQDREWALPAVAINLEIMAQNGKYVFWEQDGDVFKRTPTNSGLNELLMATVEKVTGEHAYPAGPLISDCSCFLEAGIPASTLGTFDRRMAYAGLHRATDELKRVDMGRLPEAVEILGALVCQYDQTSFSAYVS